jgi:hypothetical protein
VAPARRPEAGTSESGAGTDLAREAARANGAGRPGPEQSPQAAGGSADPDLAIQAAWTMVANALLNLDEAENK